jgi:ABC-type cobalamin/Fe3+-siderophores transport system ATPase subunit
MSNTAKPRFASFWKCALQVNPATYIKFRGTDHGLSAAEYNQQLLDSALANGIKIIGIADHGNADAYVELRDLMSPHGIIVFPGFEISSSEKAHFVCLFSETTSPKDLDRYLGHLGMTDSSESVLPCNLTAVDLLRRVAELGGFAFAAHCTDDNGVLFRKLPHVWKDQYLVACQIPGALDNLKDEPGSTHRQILLNKTPEYRRERPIAIINAKDVVRPEDLANPKTSCLVKMTEPGFEAFKLAFRDPESRVRLNSDLQQGYSSAIECMSITGGYLDGLQIQFSNYLNAVIGGRGTGKSTLIECLRYALELTPISKAAIKLHEEIVKENLGRVRGQVELRVRSAAMRGKVYTISRKYGEAAVVRDSDGRISSFTPREVLPGIDIYGQNEINEIAKDSQSQRQLLERFQGDGLSKSRKAVGEALSKLAENRKRLIEAKSQIAGIEDERTQLGKLQERLSQFRDLGVEDKLRVLPLLEVEKRFLERVLSSEVVGLRDAIFTVEQALPDTAFLSEQAISGLPDAESFRSMRSDLDAIRARTVATLSQLKQDFEEFERIIREKVGAVQQSISSSETNLERTFRELPSSEGKSGRQIGVEYQALLRDAERLRPSEAAMSARQRSIDELVTRRNELLDELSSLRAEQTDAISRTLISLNRKLAGKLRLTVQTEADRQPLVEFLLSLKLENVGGARLNWIKTAKGFSPRRLAELARAGSETLMAANWGITPSVADSLSKLTFAQTLSIEELELPDSVSIELNVTHGGEESFRAIEKLSTGQLCTAILHLLLLENHDPLVVDQPEDNLDNAFIADRIVAELRSAKISRQFLFSTHNANIPVFGDAEWIGVLQSDSNRGTMPLDFQGAVDVPDVRDQAAEILEGGREAFLERHRKYGY